MQRDFRRFVQECQALGHDCRIYYISWQGEPLPGVDARAVPVTALSNHRRNKRYSRWVLKDLERDPVAGVIGFNKMPGLDIYYAADSCYLDKALHERSWWYRLGARYRHFASYEKAVFDAASDTQILLISDTENAKFLKYYKTPSERMHMLPPGISRDRRAPPDAQRRRLESRAGLGLSGDEHVLLFIGSGFVKKGLDRAIRALASVQAALPGVRLRLLVVGQDKQRRFRRLAVRLGVVGDVEFLGGRDDVADLLLAADMLVHPALDEAAGIALLEALVSGLPVLVTDVCGYAHHIADSGGGVVLSSPFSQEAFNDALRHSLQAEFLQQCQDNALRYANTEDLYSMHATGAKLIEQLLLQRDAGTAHE